MSERSELTTRDKVRRLAVALLVIGCIVGLGFAVAATREVDDNGDPIVESANPCDVDVSGDVGSLPECDPTAPEELADAVEQVFPAEDSEALQQVQVGIDLGNRYTGVLVVGGIEVPESQLIRQEALNQVFFSPGDGFVVEEWAPGRNCVEAIYWPIVEGRGDSRTIEWCFEVT